MANDRNGNPIVLGDTYVIAGVARVVDATDVLVVLSKGQALRVAAADVVPIDDLGGGGGGVPDHGALTGLGDNDHPQYALLTYVDAQDSAIVGGTLAALAAKQDVDATLSAIAGLTTAAGQVTKWTGIDTCTQVTIGAFGETMLATATAASARSALGLEEYFADVPFNDVTMNTVYADLCSKVLTLVAGDQVELEVTGTVLNNSGVARTYRWLAQVGTMTIESIDGTTIGFSATNRAPFCIRAVFCIRTTSDARGIIFQDRATPGAANTGLVTSGNTIKRGWQTSSANLTGANTCRIQARSDNATATQQMQIHSYKITRIPQRL